MQLLLRNTVILEIEAVFKKCELESHPSICITKKIIIFVNAIIIANGTGKDHLYVLNNVHDMLLAQYLLAATY